MDNGAEKEGRRRVIKRYSNRKLYDTRDSRYVTLLQIAEMVRNGEDVQIIDNTTKEDKTEVTLALAISEELKTRPRAVSVGSLRTLIQEHGEKLLTSLREGAIGRLIPAPGSHEGPKAEEGQAEAASSEAAGVKAVQAEPATVPKHESRLAELVASSRHTLDQWQHAMDERIRAVIPGLKEHTDLQAEVCRLAQRVEALEKQLASRDSEGAEGLEGAVPSPSETEISDAEGSTEGGVTGGGGDAPGETLARNGPEE